jgi:hypothetical protein
MRGEVENMTYLEKMTPEEIELQMMVGDRKITLNEAKILHDMIHKTEKATKTFTMSDVEYENAKKFAENHAGCMSKSALSEKFEYVFVPGGIGTTVSIKCLICGKEENITDYGCW